MLYITLFSFFAKQDDILYTCTFIWVIDLKTWIYIFNFYYFYWVRKWWIIHLFFIRKLKFYSVFVPSFILMEIKIKWNTQKHYSEIDFFTS